MPCVPSPARGAPVPRLRGAIPCGTGTGRAVRVLLLVAVVSLAACQQAAPPPAPPAPEAVAPSPPPKVVPAIVVPPGVTLPSLDFPPGALYACDVAGTRTAIEFEPRVEQLCRRHPEMGPCQYERNLCRSRGGRVYTQKGEEVTPAVEAEYDRVVRRVRFQADGGDAAARAAPRAGAKGSSSTAAKASGSGKVAAPAGTKAAAAK